MFGPVSEGMRLFRSQSTVAVIGYSSNPHRVVQKVTQFLREEGNHIMGVNPKLVGHNGESLTPVVAKLADLEKPVDIIQIFRRNEALPDLADEILALPWKPKLIWCQQGVYDVIFQKRLEAEGIPVVMDACPYALRSYL